MAAIITGIALGYRGGLVCRKVNLRLRPVGYRYFAGSYNYAPGFSRGPRYRFCRTVIIETPSGQHRRVKAPPLEDDANCPYICKLSKLVQSTAFTIPTLSKIS